MLILLRPEQDPWDIDIFTEKRSEIIIRVDGDRSEILKNERGDKIGDVDMKTVIKIIEKYLVDLQSPTNRIKWF